PSDRLVSRVRQRPLHLYGARPPDRGLVRPGVPGAHRRRAADRGRADTRGLQAELTSDILAKSERSSPVSIRWTVLRRQDRAKARTPLRAERRAHMRFMVIVKASEESEAGILPDQKILTDMNKFNEQLVKAGVMLAGEGLHASKEGVRVRFDGKKRTVIDGPFAETKELVAGFWLWQCKSRDEAIEWLKRAPF